MHVVAQIRNACSCTNKEDSMDEDVVSIVIAQQGNIIMVEIAKVSM